MEQSSRSQHCSRKARGRLCTIVVEYSGTSRQDSIPMCRSMRLIASETNRVEEELVEGEDGMSSSRLDLPSRDTSW